jgi:tetrahydromethanopterin S-methyltransferase subunit D
VVVVVVGSTVLVAAGAAGEGVVTLVVVEVVASFSLLQPANNAKVTKPVAIIALVFIVVSYCFKFNLGLIPKKFQVKYNPSTKRAIFCKKVFLGLQWVIYIMENTVSIDRLKPS